MAKQLYPITIDGAEQLLPANEPVTITVGDKTYLCTLHQVSEPKTKLAAGWTPVRHIEITAATVPEQRDQLAEGLDAWISSGYLGPKAIRDAIERDLAREFQAEARKIIAGKEPSEAAIMQEANSLKMADYQGKFELAWQEATRLARAKMPANGVDSKRFFAEFLGV